MIADTQTIGPTNPKKPDPMFFQKALSETNLTKNTICL